MGKLNTYFKVRRNITYERAHFKFRNQHDGESAEQYIMEIHKLTENCDYGTLKEELIHDRLVVGIQNSQLSESFQLDPNLTLEKAKKKIRQREAVQEQTQEL